MSIGGEYNNIIYYNCTLVWTQLIIIDDGNHMSSVVLSYLYCVIDICIFRRSDEMVAHAPSSPLVTYMFVSNVLYPPLRDLVGGLAFDLATRLLILIPACRRRNLIQLLEYVIKDGSKDGLPSF